MNAGREAVRKGRSCERGRPALTDGIPRPLNPRRTPTSMSTKSIRAVASRTRSNASPSRAAKARSPDGLKDPASAAADCTSPNLGRPPRRSAGAAEGVACMTDRFSPSGSVSARTALGRVLLTLSAISRHRRATAQRLSAGITGRAASSERQTSAGGEAVSCTELLAFRKSAVNFSKSDHVGSS